MQNKANLLDTQMNVSSVTTKEYENKSGLLTMEKQTQSNPNKLGANLPLRGRRSPTGELLGTLKPGPKQSQFQYKKSGFKSKLLIFDHLALLLLSPYHLRAYVNLSLFSCLTRCPFVLSFFECGDSGVKLTNSY
jgi:hypothetical protein